jgi:polyhydroxybutyrate depolymerase
MKKTIRKTLLGILAFLVLLVLGALIAFTILNRTNGTIQSAGQQRKYLLYVPESYDPSKPASLVISFHGFIEWPDHQRQVSQWNKLADKNGFIVVYPMGTGFPLRWGTIAPSNHSKQAESDVIFISDLIDKLSAEYKIDPRRIYANGLSNGGGMSFLLACKLANRIAAIGGVSGAYSIPWSACNPSRPVPVIAFHGDADPIVPYQGGTVSPKKLTLPDIAHWAAHWARFNGCGSQPVDLTAIGEVSGIHYTNCAQNADVEFYTVHGGGHSWPGGEALPKFIVGHTTQDIDATRVMWRFFQEHPLPENGAWSLSINRENRMCSGEHPFRTMHRMPAR